MSRCRMRLGSGDRTTAQTSLRETRGLLCPTYINVSASSARWRTEPRIKQVAEGKGPQDRRPANGRRGRKKGRKKERKKVRRGRNGLDWREIRKNGCGECKLEGHFHSNIIPHRALDPCLTPTQPQILDGSGSWKSRSSSWSLWASLGQSVLVLAGCWSQKGTNRRRRP